MCEGHSCIRLCFSCEHLLCFHWSPVHCLPVFLLGLLASRSKRTPQLWRTGASASDKSLAEFPMLSWVRLREIFLCGAVILRKILSLLDLNANCIRSIFLWLTSPKSSLDWGLSLLSVFTVLYRWVHFKIWDWSVQSVSQTWCIANMKANGLFCHLETLLLPERQSGG